MTLIPIEARSGQVKSPPGNWYVDDASAFAEGEVSLFVSPTPVK